MTSTKGFSAGSNRVISLSILGLLAFDLMVGSNIDERSRRRVPALTPKKGLFEATSQVPEVTPPHSA